MATAAQTAVVSAVPAPVTADATTPATTPPVAATVTPPVAEAVPAPAQTTATAPDAATGATPVGLGTASEDVMFKLGSHDVTKGEVVTVGACGLFVAAVVLFAVARRVAESTGK